MENMSCEAWQGQHVCMGRVKAEREWLQACLKEEVEGNRAIRAENVELRRYKED